MEVNNNLNTSATQTSTQQTSSTQTTANQTTANQTATNETSQYDAVVYEKSTETAKKNYKPDAEKIKTMLAESEREQQAMTKLLQKMFNKQATTFETSISFLKEHLTQGQEIDPQIVEQAKQDVSEDGYWGVKQTSDRIISFAKALTGGDPSKIELMKEAVIKGFDQAKEAWGDEMPAITKDTYDNVMKQFDEWEASAKAE